MLTLTYSIRNKAVPVSDGAKRFLLVFRAPPARGKARTPKVRESRDSRVPDLLSPRTPLSPAVCVVLRTKTHLPLSKAHMNAPAQRTFNVNRTLPRSCSAAPRRLSVKLRDGHLLDGRVDLAARRLLGDAVVVVAVARGAEALDELLVVRDDDELEVLLLLAVLDHLVQRGGEGLGVGRVEVGRRLVERQDAAVDAKRLGEGEPDDEAGEHLASEWPMGDRVSALSSAGGAARASWHLLPRGAAAAHVEQVVT